MKRIFKISLCVLLAILLLFIWIGILIVGYKPTAGTAKYDCAIVLGAGVTDGKPSPVFQARLEHARDLYLLDQVKKVITTGGVGKDDLLSEGEVGGNFLVLQGVEGKDIYRETRSKTTLANLRGAKAIMTQERLQTAVLISDPYHLRRAERVAKHYGIDVYTSPTPFTRYQSLKTKFPFLFSEIIFSIEFKLWKMRQ